MRAARCVGAGETDTPIPGPGIPGAGERARPVWAKDLQGREVFRQSVSVLSKQVPYPGARGSGIAINGTRHHTHAAPACMPCAFMSLGYACPHTPHSHIYVHMYMYHPHPRFYHSHFHACLWKKLIKYITLAPLVLLRSLPPHACQQSTPSLGIRALRSTRHSAGGRCRTLNRTLCEPVPDAAAPCATRRVRVGVAGLPAFVRVDAGP